MVATTINKTKKFIRPNPPSESIKLKLMEPTKPSNKPIDWANLILNLKITIPMINVNKGVSALSMPVNELVISVCAIANRKAGIKIEITPIKIIYPHFSFGTVLIFGIAYGSKNKNANESRSEPNCPGEKTSNPFLIKIKELPQINERVRSSIHACRCRFLISVAFI